MVLLHDLGTIILKGLIGKVCRARAIEAKVLVLDHLTKRDEFKMKSTTFTQMERIPC